MIFIYCDASFRNTDRIGVIGFLIFDGEQPPDIQCQTIAEINNIRCELRALLEALRFVAPRASDITIYTDCEATVKLPARREHLEKNNYQSLRSGKLLNNADLYQDFFALWDTLKPTIHWTKGHTSSVARSTIQKNFSIIDQAVRNQLRSIPVATDIRS